MSDPETLGGGAALQFDHAESAKPAEDASPVAVTCAACHSQVRDEYFDVNGHSVCGRCRTSLESAAETPPGIGPFAIAAACGFFAALAGAIIYYVVLAFAHLQIGLVAILIGYMVGYSVRKGARGGGLRFQILALALTYAAVAFAYAPIVIGGAMARDRAQAARTVNGEIRPVPVPTAGDQAASQAKPNGARLVVAIVALLGLTAAFPVLFVLGSFPSGLITAFIIFIGLRQAWRMTAAPHIQVLGPYRIGTATTATGPTPA